MSVSRGTVEPMVYTPAEVAVILQISEASVYRRCALPAGSRGEIPCVRSGRSVRIPRWWVEEQIGRVA